MFHRFKNVAFQPFARRVSDQDGGGGGFSWRGEMYWGVCHRGLRLVSSSLTAPVVSDSAAAKKDGKRRRVMISFTEVALFTEKLQGQVRAELFRDFDYCSLRRNFEMIAKYCSKLFVVGVSKPFQAYQLWPASGAGYKLLCVARGFADVYATARGSTYR